MKKILFLFLGIPFFAPAQEKKKEISVEEVQSIYDSLPKENGQVQWFEVITLDSSYTKDLLNRNAETVFSRILNNGREITRTDGKQEGKISGIGTFTINGNAQNNFLSYVEESREVDFTVEIAFRNGGYSYRISEVTSIRERKSRHLVNTGTFTTSYMQTDYDQLTLEQAYKVCSKSSSKKMERRIFYRTIEKLQYNIELLKLIMSKSSKG